MKNGQVEEVLKKLAQAQQMVAFDKGAHSYRIGGVIHTSVTTALNVLDKPALKFWASKVQSEADEVAVNDWLKAGGVGTVGEVLKRVKHAFQRYSAKAKDIGSEAHELIEWTLRKQIGLAVGPQPEVSNEASYVVSSFNRWAKEFELKPLAMEQIIFSQKNKIAGKFDCLTLVPKHPLLVNKLVLADWKSAKDLYEEHTLQTITYHGLFAELLGLDPKKDVGSMLVRLPKDAPGEPEVKVVEWDPVAYKAVLGLLGIVRWRKA